MTLRDALVIAIDLLREQGDRDPSFRKAEKKLQAKASRLGEQREARACRHACPRCGRNTDNIVCISCWHGMPYELRVCFSQAKTSEVKRVAIRGILTWAKDSTTEVAA